jgi:hypothetical protein
MVVNIPFLLNLVAIGGGELRDFAEKEPGAVEPSMGQTLMLWYIFL